MTLATRLRATTKVEMPARILWVPGAGLPGSWADARSW
jgi:hypothetical protein